MSACADCNETTSGCCPKHAMPVILPLAPQAAPVGWLCPACGSGNAPWASRCPCQPLTTAIGAGSATSTNSETTVTSRGPVRC